jgi:hypothetical protein
MPDAGMPDEILEAIEEERQLAELQSRVDRSWALRLEALFARSSPGVVGIIGVLVLALIGIADAASGGFAFEVFYLVPVGLVTFGRGRTMGLLVAGVAAIAWASVEVFQGTTTLEASVTYWNAVTRFYGFAAVALLIAPMRQAMVIERQLAERESEIVEQLRAMEELREAALQPGDEEQVITSEPIEIDDPSLVSAQPEALILADAGVEEGLLDALSDLERDARRERASGA